MDGPVSMENRTALAIRHWRRTLVRGLDDRASNRDQVLGRDWLAFRVWQVYTEWIIHIRGVAMSQHVFHKKRSGFNAIELVVVVVIVFILIGLVLVVLKSRKDNSRIEDGRAEGWMKLKYLALACHNINHVYKKLPPAFDQYGQMRFPASVHVHLLPYIEGDNLYKMFLEHKEDGELPDNARCYQFLCNLDYTQTKDADSNGVQNYAANLRVFSDKGMATKFDANMPALAGIEPSQASIPGSFSDGTSNTIFFATKLGNCQDGGSRYVAAPDSKFAAFFGQNASTITASASDPRSTFQLIPLANQCLITPLLAQSMSDSGISVGMGDGSVRFISATVSPRTWNLLVQPNDGMELGKDWE
jgi:competence protein ComGC